MTINEILEYRKRKNKKILTQETKNINQEFYEEFLMEEFFIAKNGYGVTDLQKRIKKLKELEKKYLPYINIENTIRLIGCLSVYIKEYRKKLIEYTNDNILIIVENYKLNSIIRIFEKININDKKIVQYIKFLKDIKSGKINILDYGGNTSSYRDIQDSISIGSSIVV